MTRVAVLGAGIAGLTASYVLKQHGYQPHILEKRGRPGGMIRTTRQDDFVVEHGPATIRASTALLEDLLRDLNLDAHVVGASDRAKRRYIVRDGRPIPLPESLLDFLTTPVLSLRAKLRLLAEPFVSSGGSAESESVADFVRRRFGPEAVTYGVDPLLTGIFAGDPQRLSVNHVFPTLSDLEREHGSLLRGMWSRRKTDAVEKHQPTHRIFSFRDGMAQLPNALAERMNEALHLETEVTGLSREGKEWIVQLRQDDVVSTLHADAVITTLPLPAWKHLVGDLADAVAPLVEVEYPPVATLTLGFLRQDVGHPLDGFGMLVPSAESSYSMLGAIFTSSLFPEQVPSDHVMLSVRVGGTRQPELARLPMMDLRRRALEDLRSLLDVEGDPVLTHHAYWPEAIPQYNVGYERVLQCLDELEGTHPGLFFAGNYRHGISVTDAMESGNHAAQAVLKHFEPN